MSERDRFDEIADGILDAVATAHADMIATDLPWLASVPAAQRNILSRAFSDRVAAALRDAVAAETERCASMASTEAIKRAAYAGKLDRSGEVNVGAQQHMASLALSQIAAAIREPQHPPVQMTNAWLAGVVQHVESLGCDEPLASRPPSMACGSEPVAWVMDAESTLEDELWRARVNNVDLRVMFEYKDYERGGSVDCAVGWTAVANGETFGPFAAPSVPDAKAAAEKFARGKR